MRKPPLALITIGLMAASVFCATVDLFLPAIAIVAAGATVLLLLFTAATRRQPLLAVLTLFAGTLLAALYQATPELPSDVLAVAATAALALSVLWASKKKNADQTAATSPSLPNPEGTVHPPEPGPTAAAGSGAPNQSKRPSSPLLVGAVVVVLVLVVAPALSYGLALLSEGESERPPERLDVTLTEVLVGPVDANGQRWDSTSTIDPSLVAAVLEAPTYAAAAALSLDLVGSGFDPPDVYGEATLKTGQGREESLHLNGSQDDIRTNFLGASTFHSVTLADAPILEVTLWDGDTISSPEYVGRIEFRSADFLAAYDNGGQLAKSPYPRSPTLLYISISVVESTATTPTVDQ